MKVAIVTPTIGNKHFSKCLTSVQNQTYNNLIHYVFLDGEKCFHDVMIMANGIKNKSKKIKSVGLQDNVGKDWYGHRVYAACSFLVNADIICYLDEDNWIEPNHIKKLVSIINNGYDWAYSLRKIYDKNGTYICNDDCESLGKWPVYFDDNVYHIDTSCFAIKTSIATQIGHSWYKQWGADRQFFFTLRKYFPNYNCTNEYSLCYRLDGNPNSVKADFFTYGNKINKEKYEKFPWNSQGKNNCT